MHANGLVRRRTLLFVPHRVRRPPTSGRSARGSAVTAETAASLASVADEPAHDGHLASRSPVIGRV